jgi:hypothetical protein
MDILQSLLIGIISSLISTGIISFILVYIFRIPSFDLYLDYIGTRKIDKINNTWPTLDISIINKKKLISFEKDSIYFGLYIPKYFIDNKKLHLVTTEGMKLWIVNTVAKDIFRLNNIDYLLYRGMVNLPVQPDSRVNFLRISGNTDTTTIKIYYYFETKYGRFPRFLKFGGREKIFKAGKLPYSEININ